MKKRILVLGIALVLLALVVGSVFALQNKDGVVLTVIQGKSPRLSGGGYSYYIELHNSNDYTVNVYISNSGTIRTLTAGETIYFAIASADRDKYSITRVVRK